MQTVLFANLPNLPTSLLLPMRLIVYNGGNRKLVITSATMDLPQPVVGWLQESVQYRGLIDHILPAATPTESAAHLLEPPAGDRGARAESSPGGSLALMTPAPI